MDKSFNKLIYFITLWAVTSHDLTGLEDGQDSTETSRTLTLARFAGEMTTSRTSKGCVVVGHIGK